MLIGCTGPTPDEGDDSRLSESSADTAETEARFVDITEAAGLSAFVHETGDSGQKWMPESMGGGGGFIDYNDDDWLDILLVGGATWPQFSNSRVQALRLYRNDGDGSFTEVTAEAGLNNVTAYGMGVTVGDYDNDGDDDFYFTTLHENKLFRNDGGQFTEVAEVANVAGPDEWSTCSVFFDADRDGHLDLYTCGYVVWSPAEDIPCYLGEQRAYCPPEEYPGLHGRYYHNDGDGTFTERTDAAGFLPFGGKSLGAVEIDVDKDGWVDLLVANDSERNLFYHNNGDGTFSEKSVRAGVAYDERGQVRGGMGIDAGDVTGDGTISVFIGNFSEQMIGVFEQTTGALFRDRAAASRIGQPTFLTLTFGLFLFDLGLDGDLDLFAANGHIQERYNVFHDNITYRQAPQLFINDGTGVFSELDPDSTSPLARSLVARGAAYGDIDRDGDQDILVTENGGPVHLWRNDTDGGHWLRIELQGQSSNRSGIGAYIEAFVDSRRMERWVQSGASYLSASEQVATFGLDEQQAVDSLIVHWPNGQTDRLIDVQGGQQLRIVEGMGTRKVTARSPTPESSR